jgi:hypothetical protein
MLLAFLSNWLFEVAVKLAHQRRLSIALMNTSLWMGGLTAAIFIIHWFMIPMIIEPRALCLSLLKVFLLNVFLMLFELFIFNF